MLKYFEDGQCWHANAPELEENLPSFSHGYAASLITSVGQFSSVNFSAHELDSWQGSVWTLHKSITPLIRSTQQILIQEIEQVFKHTLSICYSKHNWVYFTIQAKPWILHECRKLYLQNPVVLYWDKTVAMIPTGETSVFKISWKDNWYVRLIALISDNSRAQAIQAPAQYEWEDIANWGRRLDVRAIDIQTQH